MQFTKFGTYFLFVVVLLARLDAQMTPSVNLITKPTSRFDVVLADAAHRDSLPPSLLPQLTILPPGSFVIRNKTEKAITAMLVVWIFTDADGKSREHPLNSDAYYLPNDWVVVKPLSVLLLTPMGYATQDQFQRLASSDILDPLPRVSGPKAIDTNRITSISVSLDSVIFEDGAIFGPDQRKYYLQLMTRRSVLHELSAEFKEAKTHGENFPTHLQKVMNVNRTSRNDRELMRFKLAAMFQNHPEPERLMERLESRPPLPEFHHIQEGENQ